MIKIKRIAASLLWIGLALSLILIAVFFFIQKIPKNLDSTRIALIDSVENNYIFRGNNPFVTKNGEKVFAYDELTKNFNSILNKQGLALPQDYYLVDFSLLDLDEYYDIEKERKFFAANPQAGRLINVSTLSPSLLLKSSKDANKITKEVIENYNSWLTETLEKLHEIAAKKLDKPVVIYIHCNSGRDRTGMIAANYRLLFSKMNLAEVRQKNIAEAGRNSDEFYDRAMRSYCLHVKQSDSECI